MTENQGEHVEVAVLGGGPGGYPAAFAAADRGMQVTLIDDGLKPGGACLHRGCIPSKALLHIAKVINESRDAVDWGITFGEPQIDLDRVRQWKSEIVEKLTGGIDELCRARGVRLINSRGRFLSSDKLELSDKEGRTSLLSFDHLILATGSSPIVPSVFDIDDLRVMTSAAALELEEIPASLLVIGGGYIGLEMGSIYAALGSKVTVVEMTAGLLPGADRDLVGPLKRVLESRFDAIHLKTRVVGLETTSDGIVAELDGVESDGEDLDPKQTFSRVLVAVGRRPNSSNLGIEHTQIQLDERGFVEVNRQQQTAEPKIMAVGDVAGEPMLAHKATREAIVAVEVLAGEPAEFDNVAIPAVVFTDPELAWCGLTETAARSAGRKVKASRFPWAASGRAQTLGRTEGITKIVFDAETERVLGMGIVGPGAGELIAEGVLAIEMGAAVRDIAECIHAHPTLSETVMEAAENVFSQATHIYRPKR